jgi:glycerol-3-phosphate acyltransferase PlsX
VTPPADRPLTVAVDLLGGDGAPESVIDGVLLARSEHPEVSAVLVGPPELADRLLRERGVDLPVAPASQAIGMEEDPARAVRRKRDATVRVAAKLVRDGAADATVSAGSTGAAMAAALFTLGRLPGMTRPALAVVLPAVHGPVVLLDAGAGVEATTDLLAQFALAGAAYATARLGLPRPRVGLLSVGEEAGKGDPLRKDAYELLERLPVEFVGNVEGHDVPVGGPADVVVTDGFTGNVLLKGLEGTYQLVLHALGLPDDSVPALSPERLGGAILLGVDGVVVIGHGGSSPLAISSCIGLAGQVAEQDLVGRTAATLAELVASRRAAAGLPERALRPARAARGAEAG